MGHRSVLRTSRFRHLCHTSLTFFTHTVKKVKRGKVRPFGRLLLQLFRLGQRQRPAEGALRPACMQQSSEPAGPTQGCTWPDPLVVCNRCVLP